MAADVTSSTAWALVDGLRGLITEPNNTAKASTATVMDVDDNGLIWVMLPGAEDKTPVNGAVLVDANPGDVVRVDIDGGQLSIVGNATTPAVGQSQVNSAVEPVANLASLAKSEADRAHVAAESAEADALRAFNAANSAEEEAHRAYLAAEHAEDEAQRANVAATSAVFQLSVVEDVAGTLNWISEHGKYVKTTDTTVVSDTIYFELKNGDYSPILEPTGNPSEQNWYILDVSDSQSDYIMAHLAVTSMGLWILPSAVGIEYVKSTDTSVISGKKYYTRSGSGTQASPYYYTPVSSPSGNPTTNNYYVRATQTASGYKMLLSDNGSSIYDASGIMVANFGPTAQIGKASSQHVSITPSGVSLFKNSTTKFAEFTDNGLNQYANGVNVANFGNTARIGKTNSNHIVIDDNSFKMIDKQGNTYMLASDLRNANGLATVTEELNIIHDSTDRTDFYLACTAANTQYTVTNISGRELTSSMYIKYNDRIHVTTGTLYFRSKVRVVYRTVSALAKAFVMGVRKANSVNGIYSFASGYNNTASGAYSTAHGYNNEASAQYSYTEGWENKSQSWAAHTEGRKNVVSGEYSHSEGLNNLVTGAESHVEGHDNKVYATGAHVEGSYNVVGSANNSATAVNAHVEGSRNVTYGANSHAQGQGTIANNNQTTIGQYNVEDKTLNYAIIVGNGTSTKRSNALAIRWDGTSVIQSPPYTQFSLNTSNVKAIKTQYFRRCLNVVQFYIKVTCKKKLAAGKSIVIGKISTSKVSSTIGQGCIVRKNGWAPILTIGVDAHSFTRRAVVSSDGTITITTSTAIKSPSWDQVVSGIYLTA